jgi:hypothetical protein
MISGNSASFWVRGHIFRNHPHSERQTHTDQSPTHSLWLASCWVPLPLIHQAVRPRTRYCIITVRLHSILGAYRVMSSLLLSSLIFVDLTITAWFSFRLLLSLKSAFWIEWKFVIIIGRRARHSPRKVGAPSPSFGLDTLKPFYNVYLCLLSHKRVDECGRL